MNIKNLKQINLEDPNDPRLPFSLKSPRSCIPMFQIKFRLKMSSPNTFVTLSPSSPVYFGPPMSPPCAHSNDAVRRMTPFSAAAAPLLFPQPFCIPQTRSGFCYGICIFVGLLPLGHHHIFSSRGSKLHFKIKFVIL
jgi:hypothetical protein